MNLRPGSPQGRAPAAPAGGHDMEESIGGNMDLGEKRGPRRGTSLSLRWGKSRRGASMSGKKAAAKMEDDEDDETDLEAARFGGRNAIPDDVAE